MIRIVIAALAAAGLGGCFASAPKPPPEPVVVVREAELIVPVPCLDAADVPPRPDRYADETIGADTPDDQVVLRLGRGVMQRAERELKLDAILAGCVQGEGAGR